MSDLEIHIMLLQHGAFPVAVGASEMMFHAGFELAGALSVPGCRFRAPRASVLPKPRPKDRVR